MGRVSVFETVGCTFSPAAGSEGSFVYLWLLTTALDWLLANSETAAYLSVGWDLLGKQSGVVRWDDASHILHAAVRKIQSVSFFKRRTGYAHYLKNIPITSNEYYTKRMTAKTEEFVKRICWKAFFHLNPTEDGFKSTKTAPKIKELQNFENDLCSLVNNIQFTNFRSQFQKNLSEYVKRINGNKNVLIPADKTRNLYEMSDSRYNKLLLDNITTTYKILRTTLLTKPTSRPHTSLKNWR